MPRRWKIFLIVAFVSLIADQITKYWARESLPVVKGAGVKECDIPDDIVARKCFGKEDMLIGEYDQVEVEKGVYDRRCTGTCVGWRLSFNPGSAFGLFSSATGARIFLSVVGVVAVFGMLWMLKKAREDQKALIWALGLVAGGAVGNLIDRVYYGVVTDFALLAAGKSEWPVFNVADVALVVGVGLMFLDIHGESKREKAEKAAKAAAKAKKDDKKGPDKPDKDEDAA